MVAWLIVAAIAAFLFCLFQLPLKLRVAYLDGKFSLRLGVLFVTLWRLPKKPKRRSLRYYSLKNIRRREKKAALAAQEQKRKKKKPGAGAEEAEAPSEEAGVADTLLWVKNLAGRLIRRGWKYLRVDLVKLCVTAASDDPAKTAVLYGALSPVFLGLHELLLSVKNIRLHANTRVSLRADFAAAKPSAEIDLRFSVRLWQAAAVAVGLLIEYVRQEEKKDKSVHRAVSTNMQTGG